VNCWSEVLVREGEPINRSANAAEKNPQNSNFKEFKVFFLFSWRRRAGVPSLKGTGRHLANWVITSISKMSCYSFKKRKILKNGPFEG